MTDKRFVCHQCGRSFDLNFSNITESALKCPHCSSEFVEEIELRRHRSRNANIEPPGHTTDDDNENDSEEDSQGESATERYFGEGNFEIRSFPAGILLRGGPMISLFPPSLESMSFTE